MPVRTLRIELTDRCPLACAHCSVAAGPAKNHVLATAPGLKLIEDFAHQGGHELVLTGGEPLAHPDCLRLLGKGKAEGLQTTLFSMGLTEGGQPIDADYASTLADVLDVYRVSIHAAEARAHDSLTRVPGSFDATLRAVPVIRGAGIAVRSTFFAYPDNLAELAAVVSLCTALGVSELRVVTLVPQGRGATAAPRLSVLAQAVQHAIATVESSAAVTVRLGEATKARSGEESACRAIQEELVVNWDGWISPCHAVEPTASGSDFDNAIRVGLGAALKYSPRLATCRGLAATRPDGCDGVCLARLALLNE